MLVEQPKRGAKHNANIKKIIQITNKSQWSKCKNIRERESNTKFLSGTANFAYVYASKTNELEDSIVQALHHKASKIITIDL